MSIFKSPKDLALGMAKDVAGVPKNFQPEDYYSGMPSYLPYHPIYNPSMALAPQAREMMGGIDTSGLKCSVGAFRDLANRQGPSAWSLMAAQQQNQLSDLAKSQAAGESRGQEASVMDTLAQRGGLSSGARERAAQAGAKNYFDFSQDIAAQNLKNQAGLSVSDAEQKMKMMGMLPGMETQALEPDFKKAEMVLGAGKGDIQNEMLNQQSANSWAQNLYNQQMQGWAAGKQATAIENSGKK